MSADAAMEWAKTPRTDSVATDGWSGDAVCVPVEFAQALELELKEARADSQDAARYRWLRTEQDDGGTEDFPTSGLGVSQWTALPVWDDNILKGDELDAAIDAAISAQAAAGEGKL